MCLHAVCMYLFFTALISAFFCPLSAKTTSKRSPLRWQLLSQHKHWHGDSHLLVCSLRSVQLARQTNLTGVPSRGRCWERIKNCENGYRDRLLAFSPFGDDEYVWYTVALSKNHHSAAQLRSKLLQTPWLWISSATRLPSNLLLTFIFVSLGLWLVIHSFIHPTFFLSSPSLQPAIHPAILCSIMWFSFSLMQSVLLALHAWIRPLQLKPQFCYHLSTFHSLFIPFLFFSTRLYVYTSALSLLFINVFLSSTPLNASVFPQWLHFFFLHPCRSVSLCLLFFASPSLSSFHSTLRCQTKPGSKFIIYQVALKFMVLKGWIRLAASMLSLVWVLRATEIVSQIGLIVFGPGDAWGGFILLPRNCFVCISRQRLADIFENGTTHCVCFRL